jgi:hypothetical protein|tara:strand:+ start:1959 stop:2072 length:114 start_codon:yes stop_codon:yes gene_type:complete
MAKKEIKKKVKKVVEIKEVPKVEKPVVTRGVYTQRGK